MKSAFATLLIALWLIAPALGQDKAQRRERGRKGEDLKRIERPEGRGGGNGSMIDRVRKELDLDEEQVKEFDRIAAEFRKNRGSGSGANLKKMRELGQEMREALKAGDSERVSEIREEMNKARGGNRMDEFFDQVEDILREDQLEKLTKIKEEMKSRRGGRGNPMAQVRQLRSELKLSEEQGKQYDELVAELRENVRPGRSGAVSEDLVQQLMEAVEAGDEERIAEIRDQIPSRESRSQEAFDSFFEQLEQILEPEQVETLTRFRQQMRSGRGRFDLRACFRYVRRLELDETQRDTLRDIEKTARDAQREARRDPGEMAKVNDTTIESLREMLTDEQVAEFDRWVESQKSGRHGRGDRDRGSRQRGPRRGGERGKDKP